MVEELPAWLAPTHRRHTLADPALAGVSDLDRPGLIQRVHEAADHPTATLPDLPCRGRRQRLEPPLLVDTASRPLCPSDRPPRIGITHPANQAVSPQKVSGTYFQIGHDLPALHPRRMTWCSVPGASRRAWRGIAGLTLLPGRGAAYQDYSSESTTSRITSRITDGSPIISKRVKRVVVDESASRMCRIRVLPNPLR
jgi:hypothetical protein